MRRSPFAQLHESFEMTNAEGSYKVDNFRVGFISADELSPVPTAQADDVRACGMRRP